MSADRVIARALRDADVADVLGGRGLHVVAVGKAAAAMAAAFARVPHVSIRQAIAIGTHEHADLPAHVDWIASSHPFPDSRSEAAGNRAIAVAESVHSGEALVILLSGGASALMASPVDGISLADKIDATRLMMASGADIHALNTVRRHLSKVKGGRLAAACVGTTITLAISDVVGDDLHTIGSGPGVPDSTTWQDASIALERFGAAAHSERVKRVVDLGIEGKLADTPKPGHPSMVRASGRVIGSRVDAMEGARAFAVERGYRAIVMPDAVTGEARHAARDWFRRARDLVGPSPAKVCVISSGETTVTVTGSGTGGRNLEFALALADALPSLGRTVAVASVGTDGIDGSSGVAGGIVDSTTMTRAFGMGLAPPGTYLAANNSLEFFAPLGDAIRTGRTDTNVGDLQVLLID